MAENPGRNSQPVGQQEHGTIIAKEERVSGAENHDGLEHDDPITRVETARDEISDHEEEYHAMPR
jgi:hypothetical protein